MCELISKVLQMVSLVGSITYHPLYFIRKRRLKLMYGCVISSAVAVVGAGVGVQVKSPTNVFSVVEHCLSRPPPLLREEMKTITCINVDAIWCRLCVAVWSLGEISLIAFSGEEPFQSNPPSHPFPVKIRNDCLDVYVARWQWRESV